MLPDGLHSWDVRSSEVTTGVPPPADAGTAEGEQLAPSREPLQLTLPDVGTILMCTVGTAAQALQMAHLSAAPGLQIACLPFLPAALTAPFFDDGQGDSEASAASAQIRTLRGRLLAACLVQGLVAGVGFVHGDTISGVIEFTIAALGIQSALPAGHRLLPNYIVLAFANCSMQSLLALDSIGAQKPLVMLKAMNVSSLVSPLVMFAGLVAAWQLYRQLSALAPDVQLPAPPAAEERPVRGLQTFRGYAHRLSATIPPEEDTDRVECD